MMRGGYYGMGFGGIFVIVLLTLLVIGMVFLFKYFQQFGGSELNTKKGRALDLLNKRYAKGEILEEEYNAIKSNLMKLR